MPDRSMPRTARLPTYGRSCLNALRTIGLWVGRVQSWILLTLFYLVCLGPVALLFQRLADPLRVRSGQRSAWRSKTPPAAPWPWARAQC